MPRAYAEAGAQRCLTERLRTGSAGEAGAGLPGGGGPDHGFVGGWEGLVVAYEATDFGQPGEGAFHDSAAVEQDEALGLVGALDDRHGQVPDPARVADEVHFSGLAPRPPALPAAGSRGAPSAHCPWVIVGPGSTCRREGRSPP